MKYFIFALVLFITAAGNASVISNSGEEVEYTYQVTFRSRQEVKLTKAEAEWEALFHASHIDGMLHSSEYAEKFDVSTELIEGFAGSKYPGVYDVTSELLDDGHLWITYTGTSTAMVLKKVVKGWLGNKTEGDVELPLILDLTLVYNDDLSDYSNRKWSKCSDEHYSSSIDFYYFYNPFRCDDLAKPPVGGMVNFHIKRLKSGSETAKVPKSELRMDNGNGRLETFYFVFGFDESWVGEGSADIEKDYGWKGYAGLSEMLGERGFAEVDGAAGLESELGSDSSKLKLLTPVTMNNTSQRRFFATYVKKDGDVTLVVRAGLFPIENEETSSPLISFPKFWKEAWENGDFIYYGGHSGMGHHLSIDVMLANLSKHDVEDIQFKKSKTQVAFFDSCSSYAHYQEMYQDKKPGSLHAITYGAVSLFHLAPASVSTVFDILTAGGGSITWAEALKEIEKAQLRPAVEFLWAKKDVEETVRYFEGRKEYPSFLLNVSTPR